MAALPRLGVGLGYRAPLIDLFREPETPLECIEVVAEHFFAPPPPRRPGVFRERPVLCHCLDFSLGTPGPLDEVYLAHVAEVARALDAALVSDHLAITRTAEVELGHLNPVPPTHAALDEIAGKIRRIQEATDRLFLLENITTHLRLQGELSFSEFYVGICDAADCGMLLDVTNLYICARNLGREPLRALDSLDLSRVVQLHIVGFTTQGERLFDTHTADVQESLFAFTEAVLERAPVRAIVIERDGHFPPPERLLAELSRLDELLQRHAQPA